MTSSAPNRRPAVRIQVSGRRSPFMNIPPTFGESRLCGRIVTIEVLVPRRSLPYGTATKLSVKASPVSPLLTQKKYLPETAATYVTDCDGQRNSNLFNAWYVADERMEVEEGSRRRTDIASHDVLVASNAIRCPAARVIAYIS